MAKKKKAARRGRLIKGAWTKDDIKLLRKHFGNNSTAAVAAKLNRGLDAVKKKASRMKLRKAKAYMRKLGK